MKTGIGVRKPTITELLRSECKRRNIPYSEGYRVGDKVVDADRVTTLWDGTDKDAGLALTFEQDEHGYLFCTDALDPEQAIGAYLAGREASTEDDEEEEEEEEA